MIVNQGNRIDSDSFYPIGALIIWPSATIPDGWLLADGSEYSSTEENGKYKALYDTIGTIYGVGSESTSFKVPDLRRRFVEGVSNSNILGTALDAGLPNHKHTFTGTAVNSVSAGSHKHKEGYKRIWDSADGEYGVAETKIACSNYPMRRYENAATYYNLDKTTSVGAHTHTFVAKGTLDNASAHNNIYGKSTTVQPASVCLNYIIRYK